MAVSVMSMMGARSAGARKWWALAGLTLGVLAVGLDATVLSVALPTLAVSLHASATDLQWFVSSYTLALAVGLGSREIVSRSLERTADRMPPRGPFAGADRPIPPDPSTKPTETLRHF